MERKWRKCRVIMPPSIVLDLQPQESGIVQRLRGAAGWAATERTSVEEQSLIHNRLFWQVVRVHFVRTDVRLVLHQMSFTNMSSFLYAYIQTLTHQVGFFFIIIFFLLPYHLSVLVIFLFSVPRVPLAGDRPCGVLWDGIFCPPLVSRLPQ